MRYTIEQSPSYAYVEVRFEAGDTLVAESGAMAWMEGALDVATSTRGGLLTGLKRKLLSGESFFQNTYTARGPDGRLALAPGPAGDVIAHELDGELLLERGAYLASAPTVEVNSKFQGLKGLFSEGVFVLRCTGHGVLFFASYGDIQPVDVDGEYVVDNGYAVAWEPTLEYRVTRARRIRSFLFSDQLLLRFSGRGRVWIQSRSPRSLANWAHPFRRVERKND